MNHCVQDIDGTNSTRLHKGTNKPDRQLFLDDIEGSKPRKKGLFRTKRHVNPLEPQYILPSYVAAPPIEVKFTRDSFDVSDIEGTKSRPLHLFKQRNTHLVDDIEGAQSGWRPRHLRARREATPLNHSLNVSDITGGGFQSRRATNPLTPSYRVNGMDVADDPIKSRPRALPKARDTPFYPLTTTDIEGAQPGWRPMPQMNPPLEARRHFRNTNFIGDIPGAQADTVRHSICTDRQVNPLNPVYANLDGETLANPETPLYKQPACLEAEAQLHRIIETEGKTFGAAKQAASGGRPESCARSEESRGEIFDGTSCSTQRNIYQNSLIERSSSAPLLLANKDHTDSTNDGLRCRYSAKSTARTQKHKQDSEGSCGSPPKNNDKEAIIKRLEYQVRLLREGNQPSQRHPKSDKVNGINGARVTARSCPMSDRVGSNCVLGRRSQVHFGEFSHRRSAWSQGSARVRDASTGILGPSPLSRANSIGEIDCWEKHHTTGISRRAMEILSRGSHGNEAAQRLVLRSANGTPRVTLTPSEERIAREYREDVSAVRDLR